jgi:hypothetical protein
MNLNVPAQPHSGNMDVDEFVAFLEPRPDGEHWELIEGVAVMTAPASYAHQRIVLLDYHLVVSAGTGIPLHGLICSALNPSYLIASGLVGEPTAPVIGSAGATNMNS